MSRIANLSVEEMAGIEFDCSCGKVHKIDIHNMRIGSGILQEIPSLLSDFSGKRSLLVADKNTYRVAGSQVEDILSKTFSLKKFIYHDELLVADGSSIGRLLMELEDDIELIVTVGSGTLNDISRFVSARTKIPYVIVATAPSMDGYASVVSPLIRNGVKTTFKGVYPYAIIADTQIMKEAPMYMLQAGLGDVLGKYTGLSDWRMSRILDREGTEYYCEVIADLVENAVNKCVDAAPGLLNREEDTIHAIIEGLILSGLCIGLAGHSRPASGSEHQIAHYWEMISLQKNDKTHWLHGNKVGVATGVVLEAYRYLFTKDIKGIYRSGKYKNFNKEEWIKRVEDSFGAMADQIIELKRGQLILEPDKREQAMQEVIEEWEDVAVVAYQTLPTTDELNQILACAGAVAHPKELGIGPELFRQSLVVSKEIRNRYGVMQLLDDVGLLEEAADFITDKYYL